LLDIAAKVQQGGHNVRPDDVQAARAHGATDAEIHDIVLISAAFCMFNRYVDGLTAWTPDDPAAYDRMGAMLATAGYAK
jgi:alkylhydroperoxidase family enzyme